MSNLMEVKETGLENVNLTELAREWAQWRALYMFS
jgi:hypothetical protein